MRENATVVGKQRGEDPVSGVPKTFKPEIRTKTSSTGPWVFQLEQ
jgi:hypothetical protein